MKHLADDALRSEIAHFELRFNCEDCAHFSGHTPSGVSATQYSCVHGYPTDPHRRNSRAVSIVFCKEFELA